MGSGALWWVALGPAPTVETVVVMADKEANDARADSPLQLSTREAVNCPRCDPGGDMPISSVDFEAFEVSERLRDQQQLPSRVLATLDLKPGQRIADVGAGSGYFSYFFSDVVGAQGTVWAVEISGKAVDFLNRRLEARTPPHPNIRVVQSRKDDIRLEPGSLDWAFLCNVHLMLTEDAGDQELGLTCLKSIYRALKPGGRLAVIEPDRIASLSSPALHWSRNPSGILDEERVRSPSRSNDHSVGVEPEYLRGSELTVDQLVRLYGQAGFQLVESYGFLSHKTEGNEVFAESSSPSNGDGGQLFLILEKPGDAEIDDRVPDPVPPGI